MKRTTPVTQASGRALPERFRLRPARPEDVEEIAHLWLHAWRDGHRGRVPPALLAHRTLPSFRTRAATRVSTTTVAAMEGARPDLAGFVTVTGDEVEQLYVRREERGTGVAGQLLAHAEHVIAERFDRGWLAVVDENRRARRFYDRCGWRDVGAFMNPAETEEGTMPVPCRRYEKQLAAHRALTP